MAQNNGTVDWLVELAVRAVRGRIGAIPWIMFALAAVLTAVGAVSPGAVAIIAPIVLGFAAQHQISPLLMGLMVIHGAQAGGFSPISIYGGITNGVVEEAGLPLNEVATFLASLFVNLAAAVLLFVVLGGRDLLRRRAEVTERLGGDAAEPAGDGAAGDGRTAPGEGRRVLASSPQQGAQAYGDAEMEARSEERELERSPREAPGAAPDGPLPSRVYQLLTVAGILILAALTLFFEVDIGFAAITIGLVLTLIAPQLQKRAVGQVTWPEILLITGVGTYVGCWRRWAPSTTWGTPSPIWPRHCWSPCCCASSARSSPPSHPRPRSSAR